MKSNTFTISIVLGLLCVSSVYSACETSALGKLITAPLADVKERADEAALPTITPLASVDTSGYDENKICGKIWKAAGGTCCNQDEIAERVKVLETRLLARLTRRKEMLKKGKTQGIDNIATMKAALTAQRTVLLAIR